MNLIVNCSPDGTRENAIYDYPLATGLGKTPVRDHWGFFFPRRESEGKTLFNSQFG